MDTQTYISRIYRFTVDLIYKQNHMLPLKRTTESFGTDVNFEGSILSAVSSLQTFFQALLKYCYN